MYLIMAEDENGSIEAYGKTSQEGIKQKAAIDKVRKIMENNIQWDRNGHFPKSLKNWKAV